MSSAWQRGDRRAQHRHPGGSPAAAHARSGDRLAIPAYLGAGASFDRAIARSSAAYADQNELDHQRLTQAIAQREIVAFDRRVTIISVALRTPRRKRIAAAVVLTLISLGIGACGGSSRATAPYSSCNGSPALCSRPLNEVIFPGTHNSYAASTEPGWYFASQIYPIPRQLRDGIRALLIDIHYGVYDPANGRVRTDLAAEGSDRNKVAQQLPPGALRVADRVAGAVGLGTLNGTPKPYLCHTLCELGAEPLDRELRAVATFLREHSDQVLIVIVEDYVPPSTIEQSFSKAGLTQYVATLRPHVPLPTLGQLITSGHRLLVFAEKQGGVPTWYMPAFALIQDTPLGALHPGELSCARYRGNRDSPLLLLNHWIPPFPPSPTINAQIGRALFLRARISRCDRERDLGGAIVAVDFYNRTAVVKVAQQLNGAG